MSALYEVGTAAPAERSLPAVDRGRAMTLVIVFLLLAAGWSVYARVTGFNFIPVDDPFYVYTNQAVLHGLTLEGTRWAFSSLEGANWHPLTWLSLMADAQMYGLNPGGYHLTNLLLHETATLLLFGWLLVATGRRWPSAGVALLFCVHPAHVESVAWVTERKDVLSTVFFLLVLLAYTRYAQTKGRGYYVAALLALILGLLAKPMLVTVPPLLLLLDAWPLGRVRRASDWISLGVEKLPFVFVAAASSVITFVAQHGSGAVITLTKLPLSWRVANAVTGYAFYVGKLFWPVDLGVFYPYWTRLPLGQTVCFALALVAATAGAAFLYRSRPYLLVGWLWFLGTMVPVIGLVQVGSQAMADRYTYQPFIGLFIVLCWTLGGCWQAWPRLRPVVAAGSVAAVAACLGLCYQQVGYWRDGQTLLGHTLAVTRPEAGADLMLGDFYAVSRCPVEAEAAYRQGFKLEPNNAELVTRLGYLQLEQGHWAAACGWLQQVASRDCKDPVVFDKLGLALERLGRLEESRAAFQRSLGLRPAR